MVIQSVESASSILATTVGNDDWPTLKINERFLCNPHFTSIEFNRVCVGWLLFSFPPQ